MENQRTLEGLYCNQTLKPEIEALVKDTNAYTERMPDSYVQLMVLIQNLKSYLETLESMAADLQQISQIQDKYSKTQDA